MVECRGILYFTANDGISGYELWQSDGTTAAQGWSKILIQTATALTPD